MNENETRKWESNSLRRVVTAWRRPPEVPNWLVSVTYGDTGWECDPGTMGESPEQAVEDIKTAIKELEEAKKYIEEEFGL